MKYLIILSALFIFSITAEIPAQESDVTKEPGYFDFGDLASFENGTGVTEIFLESKILKMVAKITIDEEPELGDLLRGLKLVRANVFQVNEENQSDLSERINELDKKLIAKDWERIVRTKERDENVNVYIKVSDSDNILGLVVTTLDKHGDAAFVNIVGDINLSTIGKLGGKFDIPGLGKVEN
jgi:hypothetical protein